MNKYGRWCGLFCGLIVAVCVAIHVTEYSQLHGMDASSWFEAMCWGVVLVGFGSFSGYVAGIVCEAFVKLFRDWNGRKRPP